jgi:hypothetical protein
VLAAYRRTLVSTYRIAVVHLVAAQTIASATLLGSDGLSIISYNDDTDVSLKVAHWVNRLCLP